MRVPDSEIANVARAARTVAVLGAHTDPTRPACYVPAYLYGRGVRVLPVNAMLAGQTLFGETIRASLADIDVPVDILDVFRRSDAIAAHVPEILAMAHLPKVVWLQSGIRDDRSADALGAAGIDVVQDRCLMVEHRR